MSISCVHLPSSSRVKEQYKVEMFFCDGPLLQNILRGDRDGHAPVKETFLRSRIYDLMREMGENVEPNLSYVAIGLSTQLLSQTSSRELKLVLATGILIVYLSQTTIFWSLALLNFVLKRGTNSSLGNETKKVNKYGHVIASY